MFEGQTPVTDDIVEMFQSMSKMLITRLASGVRLLLGRSFSVCVEYIVDLMLVLRNRGIFFFSFVE